MDTGYNLDVHILFSFGLSHMLAFSMPFNSYKLFKLKALGPFEEHVIKLSCGVCLVSCGVGLVM